VYHGIHLHRSQNIIVANSLFADNINGIDIDRAEGIEVINCTVIGESDSYRTLMERQPYLSKICDPVTRRRVGIDLHTWKVDDRFAGAKISNVRLQGYNRTTCPIASSIKYDTHVSNAKIYNWK
jgi:parallel beta-helix repeat protein